VQEAGVNELAGNERQQLATRDLGMAGQRGQDEARHRAPAFDETVEGHAAQGQLIDEDDHTGDDERLCDDRAPATGNAVGERNHVTLTAHFVTSN
jgi:hypothetical protein